MKSSLVNVCDFSEFVACIIPYNVSSSGELTRTSFILLHDGIAFSGVARERLVLFIGAPLTVGRVAIFIELRFLYFDSLAQIGELARRLRFLRSKTNYKDWEFFAHGDCIHDQNIPLDHPTNATSLVCKRPQAQFQTNLCALTVWTDFATMNKIVHRWRFHVKRVFTNPTAVTTTRFRHNVYAYIARFFRVNIRESAFSSTRHCYCRK